MNHAARILRLAVLPALFGLATSGCVQSGLASRPIALEIPAAPVVVSRVHGQRAALPADAIRLLVWNVQKAGHEDFSGDFRTLAAESDLIVLQEARLHDEFMGLLGGVPRWDLVQAWQWRQVPNGVLTGSSSEALSVRALESREPMLRLDKSALVTEYRIEGSAQTLLVANVHAINFTVDTRAFRDQLVAVADLLDEHDGPVILSGDLNTWRGERRAIVHEIADALGLTEVEFAGPRKQFIGQPLDHVFYRDLELLDAEVAPVASSDHNPLRVVFRAGHAALPQE
jgi:endonuclease/exonuclease/phosphatase (EEP) superfamily protein YafD